jgi:hypothetical protein
LSKFLHEPTASLAVGNTCAFCSTHRHDRGFVNLLIDDRPLEGQSHRGRLYACAGCADEIGRAVGCLDPQQAQRLRDAMDEIAEGADKLASELASTKENMVVPLGEVIDFLKERELRRPNEPAPVVA